MIHENFHTKHSVFTVPDAHMHTSHSYTYIMSIIYTDEIEKHKRFKRTLIYYDIDTHYANFEGNPLLQATKRHLNNSETVKNNEK